MSLSSSVAVSHLANPRRRTAIDKHYSAEIVTQIKEKKRKPGGQD